MSLNVSLPPELEHRVREYVASDLYGSASEIVREALCAYSKLSRTCSLQAWLRCGRTLLKG